MIIYKLLFDDGIIKYFKAYTYRDIDAIHWYIDRHPEVLHVETIIPNEDKNYDND